MIDSTITTAIVAASLLGAILVGRWLRRFLPQDHYTADSRDTVKLAMGLVATMSALLLGLLVASAKSSYDTTRNEVIQISGNLAFLDRLLAGYGPETAEVRARLREVTEASLRVMWHDGGRGAGSPSPAQARAGDAVYLGIQALQPQNRVQESVKAEAAKIVLELGKLRALMAAQEVASISRPVLSVVAVWLVVIFLGFSVVAPRNATAALALGVSALSVTAAIFLILELDRPFTGVVKISSAPLVNTLNQMGR